MQIWHHVLHFLGVLPAAPGPVYNFWSGSGSDIGELAILGALANHYRAHKCPRCWRLGRHEVAGTHYRTCHHHLTEPDHALLVGRHAARHPAQHAMLARRASPPRGPGGRFIQRPGGQP